MRITATLVICACLFFGGCSSSKNSAEAPQGSSTNTAASKWEGKLVRRPGDSPEDGKVYLIQQGKRRWVVNAAWLDQHGYKFPADVIMIPADDLAAIPPGEEIQ